MATVEGVHGRVERVDWIWEEDGGYEHCCMLLFCVSFLMNCWSSALSLSGMPAMSGRLTELRASMVAMKN
jgi:hypothetical protein